MMELDNYRMDASFERGRIRASVNPDVQISWLSFMIEQGIDWMVGKGVHRIKFKRSQAADSFVELLIETDDVHPGPLQFAAVTNIETLHQAGFIPDDLKTPYEAAGDFSIVNSEGLRPEVTIHELSYGLSDMIVSFFLKGAENVRYQISRKNAQLMVDVGMTKRQMIDFINTDRDYGPETTMRELPWNNKKETTWR
jgi:hypothetical protein